MHKVYAHENLAMVNSAKNLLEFSNIACFIKNEYHATGGYVGFESIPLELWVYDSTQAEKAIALLERELDPARQAEDWVCVQCGETNGSAFDVCWKCQNPRTEQPAAS